MLRFIYGLFPRPVLSPQDNDLDSVARQGFRVLEGALGKSGASRESSWEGWVELKKLTFCATAVRMERARKPPSPIQE